LISHLSSLVSSPACPSPEQVLQREEAAIDGQCQQDLLGLTVPAGAVGRLRQAVTPRQGGEPRPIELIDAITPAIDAALQLDGPSRTRSFPADDFESEPPPFAETAWPAGPEDWIDPAFLVEGSPDWDTAPEEWDWTDTESDAPPDIEDLIGALVLDTCHEVERHLLEFEAESILPGREPPPQPDPPSRETGDESLPDPKPRALPRRDRPPGRRYDRLFSELRRRVYSPPDRP
ncbi:MAG: hypothetical protein ACREJB_03500, partial [Planctomycetaceae bacterium]